MYLPYQLSKQRWMTFPMCCSKFPRTLSHVHYSLCLFSSSESMSESSRSTCTFSSSESSRCRHALLPLLLGLLRGTLNNHYPSADTRVFGIGGCLLGQEEHFFLFSSHFMSCNQFREMVVLHGNARLSLRLALFRELGLFASEKFLSAPTPLSLCENLAGWCPNSVRLPYILVPSRLQVSVFSQAQSLLILWWKGIQTQFFCRNTSKNSCGGGGAESHIPNIVLGDFWKILQNNILYKSINDRNKLARSQNLYFYVWVEGREQRIAWDLGASHPPGTRCFRRSRSSSALKKKTNNTQEAVNSRNSLQ